MSFWMSHLRFQAGPWVAQKSAFSAPRSVRLTPTFAALACTTGVPEKSRHDVYGKSSSRSTGSP